ncbi:hypothetical protein EI545_15050 [Tabrizicola piscis]|uniref:Uncharacterized protein n=1 Tax=Tabrizicola piscis TaxID=2494374 RepID=A0A3S8U8I7_9RHOB|nr:hypothetical protein [Tabrizicola piscis]AZL60032.1 hypothetical protein EI545_15050 [Tabrizicola piscis]
MKKVTKGGQLAIRMEKSERAVFVDLCDQLDTSTDRNLRRPIRVFVASHAPADAASTAAIHHSLGV